jgi:predicted RND superfamily exporter protein
LIAFRVPLLILAAAIAVAGYGSSRRLDFNRSVEAVFAPDDPLLVVYRKLRRTFGGNEVVMAVYQDDDLLASDGSGIERLRQLSTKIASLPGVDFTLSLDQPLGDAIVQRDNQLAERSRQILEGYTHGADGRTAAVICVLVPASEADVPRRQTIDGIRRILADKPSGMITGEPVMIVDGFRYVERDGLRLSWATTVLLSLVILISFRSIRWVVIPILVVQLATLLTRATIHWSGLQLTMVSSTFTAIITVIGIASVVHIIVRFREGRSLGLSPREALLRAGERLATPIVLAIVTDAVGFSALGLSRVGPIRDFGWMMALGAAMVVVAIALVVPGAALIGRLDTDPKPVWGEKRLGAGLARLIGWIEHRPAAVGIVTALLVGLAFIGAFQVEIETDFTKNFRSDTSIVRAYRFVESNLGGAGVWDVVLPAPQTLDWAFLRRVRRLETRLRNEVSVPSAGGGSQPGLTKVLSLADLVVALSPIDLESLRYEQAQDAALFAVIANISKTMPDLIRVLHAEDRGHPGHYCLRIMLRSKERQPAANKRTIIDQVTQIVCQEFPAEGDSTGGEVGGYFVLLTSLVDSILRDQWLTFGAATVGIGLTMVLAFGSPVLALVALVPNALPILAVTGLVGWVGVIFTDVKINMGAAMIAAVSIGLSIDSSIHYICAFQHARRAGQNVHQAIASVQQSVGRAVVFSTVGLIVGFAVLCSSQFVPTIYFGALVSLTMLGGMAGNLVVLPLLLRLVVKDRSQQTMQAGTGQ